MSLETHFIIKEEKYSLSIVKKQSPSNKNKIKGITIFKKTLELNELNEDNVNMILKKPNKKNINSFANLGLISIAGLICFIYVTPKDIEEVGFLGLVKVYKIKSLSYIILVPDLNDKTKSNLQKTFKDYSKYETNKGLYFSENLLNLGSSYDKFYHFLYDYNPNNYHINENFNFCYNYDYMAYFRKFSLDNFSINLMKGFYYQKEIKGKENCEVIMHLIIRDINFNKEEANLNINSNINDFNYNLHELEIILTSPDYTQMFHFIFYVYSVDYVEYEKKNIIYNLLKQGVTRNKKDNGSVIIFDVIEQLDKRGSEEKNKSIIKLKNKLNKELGNNNKFIFIHKKEDINSEIEMNKKILREIKYNFEYEGTKTDFQEKNLLIISDKGYNSLMIIESILLNIKYKCWNEEREMIYEKEIYAFIKESIKVYKNFIIQKNKNFQNFKKVEIEPINDDYLNKNIFTKKEIILDNSTDEKSNNKNDNAINEKFTDNENKKMNNNIYIYIVTSNVNNFNLVNKDDDLLKELLFPKDAQDFCIKNGYPDFYCIGLQEIVKLNTSNIVLFSGHNSANSWDIRISQLLQTNYNYTLQYKENLVGILFLFFVKATEAKNINSTKKSIKKSGFLNFFGNKGSLFYEFTYRNKNFSFCTGHLSAGNNTKKYNERVNQLIDILNHQNEKDSMKFYKNNYWFIFGDLNFRVGTSKKMFFNKVDEINNNYLNDKKNLEDMEFYNEIKEDIEKSEEERAKSGIIKKIDAANYSDDEDDSDDDDRKDLNKLRSSTKIKSKHRKINEQQFKSNFSDEFLKIDELNKLKPLLNQYEINEDNIKFLPTYKYYKGTDYYNVTKRVPAWTDRILFSNNKDIKCINYDKIELKFSDHKPVYALFEINMNDDNK